MSPKRIAIACQGGGTHAAFTWGVLSEVLRRQQEWTDPGDGQLDGAGASAGRPFQVVALSGTSAGALCALAAWYGLVPNEDDPDCGTPAKAIERLDALWTAFAATTPVERTHNAAVARLLELAESGAPLPRSSPYARWGDAGLAALRALGARPEYLGFDGLLPAVCPDFDAIDWPGVLAADVRMIAGAGEVLSGNFEIFDSDKTLDELGLRALPGADDQYNATRWRMRRPLSLAGVAASGTLPEVLRATEIEGHWFPTAEPGVLEQRTGYYWDGLYSQNPPVRDLLDTATPEARPDEIWVVRINAQELGPVGGSIGLDDIRDRTNALSGNLSLSSELDHIETVNRWLRAHGDAHPPLAGRKIVRVRTIKMRRETAWGLSHTSKFDRDPGHLAALRDEGVEVAGAWLDGWAEQGDAFPDYPEDARYADA
jgi:NTE family protein